MPRFALLAVFAFVAAPAFAAPPELTELPGPLVQTDAWRVDKDAKQAFIDLAGKEDAKIIVIADSDAELKAWADFKPLSIRMVKTPKDDAITDATGVWIADARVDVLKDKAVLEAIHKLHASGKVIGGDAIGLGLLPGFHHGDEFVSGSVGLTIHKDAAVVARGRQMRVIGDGAITIRIAKGAGKPAATQEAKAGSLFDLYQLRRAAANRAEKEPFPPAKPKEPVVPKGTLVIIGGGGTTQQIMDTFFEKAGGKDALIVVIPTTEKDGPGDSGFLKRFGATNVKTLFTKDRRLASDPKFGEMLVKAGGVWFGGGRQWNFVDCWEGTLVEKRFHDVLSRGGVIGGSSAGASIQSEYMPRGHPLGNTVMAAEGYERGFGFLPGCAVDQHFFARKRTDDMTGLMKKYPQYLGIGIDEATAIIVAGNTAQVMGRSKVAFYDTKKKPDGDKDYEELFPNEKYDLVKRVKLKP
jgi:cyanophycinase